MNFTLAMNVHIAVITTERNVLGRREFQPFLYNQLSAEPCSKLFSKPHMYRIKPRQEKAHSCSLLAVLRVNLGANKTLTGQAVKALCGASGGSYLFIIYYLVVIIFTVQPLQHLCTQPASWFFSGIHFCLPESKQQAMRFN